MLNSTSDYFELFGLPRGFDMNYQLLKDRYRELQAATHPDRYAAQGDQARRLAVQRAALVNEAFQTLEDPLKRGIYLLELEGVYDDAQQTTSDNAFLMQQIEFREALDAIPKQSDPFAAADKLRDELTEAQQALYADFARDYADKAFPSAQQALRRAQFFRRLLGQLDDLEARMEDELI